MSFNMPIGHDARSSFVATDERMKDLHDDIISRMNIPGGVWARAGTEPRSGDSFIFSLRGSDDCAPISLAAPPSLESLGREIGAMSGLAAVKCTFISRRDERTAYALKRTVLSPMCDSIGSIIVFSAACQHGVEASK
jgi:ethanolamine utilization microcompartment shell protein EutL